MSARAGRPCADRLLLLALAAGSAAGLDAKAEIPLGDRHAAVEKAKGMYAHAFDSYMKHAFPADELRPLSCDGRKVRERGDLDAILGNYSLTLIDSLDSLVIFDRLDDFERAVEHIIRNVDFDLDLEVSTFEANIRMLGGLLSGHIHATKLLDNYDGGLLTQALDLGTRLRAAFETPTGMPTSRINLRHGKKTPVSSVVTVAEAGSFLIEFGVLSMLTDDGSWYRLARESVFAFWRRRSSIGLVGTAADVNTGGFSDTQSTTGPGQDSFYEYLLKSYMLFDDVELLELFYTASAAVEEYHSFEGFTYTVDMFKGLMANTHLSPLSCVWASLQVLAGDAAGGLRTVLYWYGLWSKHGALPEVFDTRNEAPTQARDSPLRPELAEAIFYLSLALPGDPTVFRMAVGMLASLDSQSRVRCGFASVADVTTRRLDDRMDSFFLSETLVYLFLTVAPVEELHRVLPWSISSAVFSTEGHLFPVAAEGVYEAARMPGLEEYTEGLYPSLAERPMMTCEAPSPFEQVAMKQRCRTKYILTAGYQLQSLSHASKKCRQQEVSVLVRASGSEPRLLRGMASALGPPVPKLPRMADRLKAALGNESNASQHFSRPSTQGELGLTSLDLDRPAGQMPDFFSSATKHEEAWTLFGTRHVVVASPETACSPLVAGGVDYTGKIAVVARGSCLFLQKLQMLQQAKLAGAVVVDNPGAENELQVMTCPRGDQGVGRDVHIPAVMVSHEDGKALLQLVRTQGNVTALMFSQH